MSIKFKIILYIGAFILLIILGIVFLPKEEILILEKNNVQNNSGEFYDEIIYVHVEGEVKNPGIKRLKKGTRLYELIELSGGETEEADLSRLNLSSILKDEQKIIVPHKIDEQIAINDMSATNTKADTSTTNNSYPININYASSSDLEKLNGIGPSMASKIIAYRNENGLFNSIEEIKNVTGIGEGKFNKIKDDISI